MATTTITALTAVTSGNLTGAAVAPVDDSLTNTRKTSLAQLRTNLLAGGTGFTAADPLVAGAATLGATAITGDSSVAGNLPVTGNVGVNAAANATSATTPFLWVPSTSGTPTGVPSASMGGSVPLVVDTAAQLLYVRIGSSWNGITIGGGSVSPAASNIYLATNFGGFSPWL